MVEIVLREKKSRSIARISTTSLIIHLHDSILNEAENSICSLFLVTYAKIQLGFLGAASNKAAIQPL